MPVGIPLSLAAGEQGAQVAHLVGSVLAPTHAAVLHPLADHRLAGRFDRTGADRPPLGLVRRIVHPMPLGLETTHHLSPRRPPRLAAVRGPRPPGPPHRRAPPAPHPTQP